MTDIAGVGSASAGLFRAAPQNQEQQQIQTQQVQQDRDGQNLTDRRVEGAGNASGGRQGAQQLDFSSDAVEQEQVDARVEGDLEREANLQEGLTDQARQSDDAVEITLSDAARRAQQQAVRIANQDVSSASQSRDDGVAQTEAGLDADDFTRIIDRNRERDDASQGESRGARELGRVIDTFA